MVEWKCSERYLLLEDLLEHCFLGRIADFIGPVYVRCVKRNRGVSPVYWPKIEKSVSAPMTFQVTTDKEAGKSRSDCSTMSCLDRTYLGCPVVPEVCNPTHGLFWTSSNV